MKSYFANSFRVAMEQARKELGPDAMLVTTRTAALEARHLGEYEVVFAAELPTPRAPLEGQERTPATSSESSKRASLPAGTDLGVMLGEMRRQLKGWRRGNSPAGERPTVCLGAPQTLDLVDELVQREVPHEIALRLVSAAENRVSGDRNRLRAALAEEIQDAFQVDSRLGVASGNGSAVIIALVGPAGAGKTATIAKLAVRHGLTARKPAILISLDTLRVGASEQLRCYASLLGLGFQVVETNRALEQSLEEHRNKELILIDTPGFTLSDLSPSCDSADFLARRTDIQKHLVLPASMRSVDISRMSAAYQVFQPSHLIFTRMDETESFGAVLGEAVASGRPISFFSAGQRVPEDLTDAGKRDLAELLLPSTESSPSRLSKSRPVESLQTAA
jgi:flagellar biosynthesis protein FlhF